MILKQVCQIRVNHQHNAELDTSKHSNCEIIGSICGLGRPYKYEGHLNNGHNMRTVLLLITFTVIYNNNT